MFKYKQKGLKEHQIQFISMNIVLCQKQIITQTMWMVKQAWSMKKHWQQMEIPPKCSDNILTHIGWLRVGSEVKKKKLIEEEDLHNQ